MSADAPLPAFAPPLTHLPSSELLAHFEALSGAVYFAVDAEQNLCASSPGLAELTGFAEQEVLGRHCLRAIRCQECLRTCGIFERGWVDAVTLTLYRKDGQPIRVVKSGLLVRNATGQPLGTIEMIWATASDMPSKGPAALPREADLLFEIMGRCFIAVDDSLRLLHYSERLATLCGCPAEQLRQLTLVDLFGVELFGPESEFLRAVRGGARREGWRASLQVSDGDPLLVSLSAAPVNSDSQGGPAASCAQSAALLVVIRPEDTPQGGASLPEFEGIVARSPSMQRIFRLIGQLRDNDATVLINGESGTGKEIVARAIHARSHRRAGPFVVVNCGALPNELLESELFGHVRGAFTGALRDKPGRFELAEGGTLFLDEIGDLPLNLQVKLLRVLQERTFERLGDPRTRHLDVRIVAATHVHLRQAVAEKHFREDLFYRLRVVPIELPPLRERREDIEILTQHFLPRIARERGRSLRLSPSTMRTLLSHSWPGNVRELQNALEYATAVCEGHTIHASDLPLEIAKGTETHSQALDTPELAPPARPNLTQPPLHAAENEEIEQIRSALAATHYRRAIAAERLGMSRTTLWRKMREHGLD